jgi:hypothetical protein
MRVFCIIWILGSICVAAPAQSLKQGIEGHVFLLVNSPDSANHESPQAGVQREVHIHELTTLDQVTQENGVFTSVPTANVVTILTDVDGSFKVKMPPGTYSVFIKEPGGLYANLFKKNQINPVVVKPRQYSWITISIEYPGL